MKSVIGKMGNRAEYSNENDSEDPKTNKTSAVPSFMTKILPDGEIAGDMNSLNTKQRLSSIWFIHVPKDYVKYDGYNVEPVQMLVLGNGAQVNPLWEK